MSPDTKRWFSGAEFSPDRKWRYVLWRRWTSAKPMVAFIGLNPSTADEIMNDPTVTRCINYAKDWDYGGMYMLNLFAFRATDPKEMKAANDPIGVANDRTIIEYSNDSFITVCCWGNHGSFMERGHEVSELLNNKTNLFCFGMTRQGEPMHPLYLKRDRQIVEYSRES